MKTSVWGAMAFPLLVLLLSGTSCSQARTVDATVLVDLSASVGDDTRTFYASVIAGSLLRSMKIGDRLQVFPVDGASEQRMEAIYSVAIDENRFSEKSDGFAKRDAKIAERISQFIDNETPVIQVKLAEAATRRKAASRLSDLIGALNSIAPSIVSPAGKSPILVILSDMVQESKEISLIRHVDEREETARELVDQLAKKGRVPALPGVTVIVVGAGEGASVSPQGFRAIRAFWRTFFQRADATLSDGDYGFRTQERIIDAVSRIRK